MEARKFQSLLYSISDYYKNPYNGNCNTQPNSFSFFSALTPTLIAMAFRSPLAAAPGTGATQKLIKSDRSMLALSDENSMMKQILTTHAPDGREFDVRPLLHVVEDILSRATLQVESTLTVMINTKLLPFLNC